MKKRLKKALVVLVLLPVIATCAKPPSPDEKLFKPNQTSAAMLIGYANKLQNNAEPGDKRQAEIKYVLMYDIYIKARSYAILNKIFFWLAVMFGLAVLLWPALTVVFQKKSSSWEWVKSATVQTTVTGIAALMFTFYSEYKDKQTYAETLIRYVLYSEDSVATLSIKVSEELARIDRGFSFNSILGEEKKQ